MNIAEMLDKLDEYIAERDALELRRQEAIDAVLTPEIKAKLAEIDAEFNPLDHRAEDNIDLLSGGIKAAVIEHGATVKGKFRQAVLTPEKVTFVYRTEALEGYAATHPEILPFRRAKFSWAIFWMGGGSSWKQFQKRFVVLFI